MTTMNGIKVNSLEDNIRILENYNKSPYSKVNTEMREKFIKAARGYIGDKYSMSKRMYKGYSDCTSLIQKSLADINYIDRSHLVVTATIPNDKAHFMEIPMSKMQRGDILLGNELYQGRLYRHACIYLGDGKILEAVTSGVKVNELRKSFFKCYRIKFKPTNVKPAVNCEILGKQINGVYAVDGISYYEIDGYKIPLRKFFESMGFSVDWDNKNKKVIIRG